MQWKENEMKKKRKERMQRNEMERNEMDEWMSCAVMQHNLYC